MRVEFFFLFMSFRIEGFLFSAIIDVYLIRSIISMLRLTRSELSKSRAQMNVEFFLHIMLIRINYENFIYYLISSIELNVKFHQLRYQYEFYCQPLILSKKFLVQSRVELWLQDLVIRFRNFFSIIQNPRGRRPSIVLNVVLGKNSSKTRAFIFSS